MSLAERRALYVAARAPRRWPKPVPAGMGQNRTRDDDR